jgi:hypothetical protein
MVEILVKEGAAKKILALAIAAAAHAGAAAELYCSVLTRWIYET